VAQVPPDSANHAECCCTAEGVMSSRSCIILRSLSSGREHSALSKLRHSPSITSNDAYPHL